LHTLALDQSMPKLKINAPKHEQESSIDELQRNKLKAEIAKIELETKQIRRPLLLQPAILSVLTSFSVPIIIFLLAFYVGGGKQYFDAQKLNLEYDKKRLESEVNDFRKDTLGLNKKYSRLASRLRTEHIQDSLKLRIKLDHINSLLSEKGRKLYVLNESIRDAKAVLPSQTIMDDFLKQHRLYENFNLEFYYDHLILFLRAVKDRERLQKYFKGLVADRSVPLIKRGFTAMSMYFAYKSPYWRDEFETIIQENLTKEVMKDKSQALLQVDGISFLLHSKYWSAKELHENNKMVIREVSKALVINKRNDRSLCYLLLSTINRDDNYYLNRYFSKGQVVRSPAHDKMLAYKMADLLMEPASAPATFITFLKAVKVLWKQPNAPYSELMGLGAKFENINRAFLSIKILEEANIEKRRAIVDVYCRSLHPIFWGLDGQITQPKIPVDSLDKTILDLEDWHRKNKDFCDKLSESNLSSYNDNIGLLIKDSNYDRNKASETLF